MIRGLVRLGVHNPVFLNLFFLLVCGAGLLAWNTLPKEEFPAVSADALIASVVYAGASPEDIEDLVLRPMEDALDGVEGIDHVYSDGIEGVGILQIDLLRGVDAQSVRRDVEQELNALDELPDEATSPRVSVATLEIPLVHVGLLGDRDQTVLAETIASELADLPGIKEVQLRGESEEIVEIVLDPLRAAARGVSPSQVVQVVQAAAQGAPAGTVQRDREAVLVRTRRGVFAPADLASLPLRVAEGSDLRLGDVATVARRWEDNDIVRRCNGQPCIDLRVMREDDADALKLVPIVQDWVAARRATLPEGLDLVAYDDSARLVQARLVTLANNGLVGIALVAGLLVLFIGRRNTLLVVWGMPVAYLGAVVMMQAVGVSVNVISTFGLLIVTGIIVDDAIVIVENVQRHLEMGKDRVQAALDGTSEVAGAVLAATLTTCLAFAPLLMLEGAVGRVMRNIPLVVILALVGSLVEAFFVLPGHLAHHAEEQDGTRENLPTRLLKRAYAPILAWVTTGARRYLALGGVLLALLATLSLATQMKTSLTTKGETVFAIVNLDLPPGSAVGRTEAAVRRLEGLVIDEAAPITLWMRGQAGRQDFPQGFPTVGARYGQIKVGFHRTPEALEEASAFLDRIRAFLDADPEVVAHEIQTLTGGPPAGRPIDLRVKGTEPDEVVATAQALADRLATREGVSDVRVELQDGATTFEVVVDPARAARFGLREAQVAMDVRAALDGLLAVELPFDGRTTEVRVGLPDRAEREALADLPLVLPQGGTVRLRQVAEVRRVSGLERIQRVDGERAVRLSAQIDDRITTGADEQAALEGHFAQINPGRLSLSYGGELADAAESFGQLPYALALAIGMIYAVLAIQFRSYLQPVIILAAVPLGMAGVVLGLFLFGMDLSLIASIGAVGLAGIVVNDSLVLVDFVNQERRRGLSVDEAVVQASLTRLRPILITTVTTVSGLLPLAVGLAGAEPLLAPMAVAISFGLSFATGLTLIAVPVLYLIVEDVEGWLRRWGGAEAHAAGTSGTER